MANQLPKMVYVLPVGRYVSGDHQNKRTTDKDGRPVPEDKQQYQFGVAVLKTAPGINELIGFQPAAQPGIWQFASQFYAQNQAVLQRMQKGFDFGTNNGGFSWKIKDGDKPDSKGQYSEHTKGCWVFYFSSSYPVKAANAQNQEIDPKLIKRGYYVDVHFSTSPNGEQGDRAGIYLNPNIMRLVGYGDEIVGGIDAATAFGGAAPSWTPPGMSQTPVAPAGGFPAQQMPGMPQGGGQMPGFPTGHQQAGGFPNGGPAPMMGNGTPAQMPNAMPGGGAPAAGYPSNQGFPQGGAPTNGFPAQNGNGSFPTGYPTNPNTGQPVQPHQQFLQPPQGGFPPRT